MTLVHVAVGKSLSTAVGKTLDLLNIGYMIHAM